MSVDNGADGQPPSRRQSQAAADYAALGPREECVGAVLLVLRSCPRRDAVRAFEGVHLLARVDAVTDVLIAPGC